MKKTIKLGCACAILSLLTGCFHLERTPASITMCNIEEYGPWKRNQSVNSDYMLDPLGRSFYKKEDDVWYSFGAQDWGFENKNYFKSAGIYYVYLPIYADRFSQRAPTFHPTIRYDPTSAYIELNGKRISALPYIWKAKENKSYPFNYYPDEKLNVPTDLDLSLGDFQIIFIGFPVNDPVPGDKYRISLGTVQIHGKEYQMPIYGSCYTPEITKWRADQLRM